MLCPECKTEAAIMESGYEVRGDTSAEETTKVFSVLKFHCRNPKCQKCGKEIGVVKHELKVKGEQAPP